MKIWMYSGGDRKNRYGTRTLGLVAGIVLLTMAVATVGVVLLMEMHAIKPVGLLFLCFGTTVLAVGLAAALGRRSLKECMAFLLDDKDRFFAVDVRTMASYRRGALGSASMLYDVQRQLSILQQQSALPSKAMEIVQVSTIQENARCYVLRCLVRDFRGYGRARTFFLVKGLEDEDWLLQELERRRGWASPDNLPESPQPRRILLCLVGLVVCATLCIFSHPAVGHLPQGIYFPCLGLAFVLLVGCTYFVVKYRRGE